MRRISSVLTIALTATILLAGISGAQSVPRTVSEGLINLERDEVVLFSFPHSILGANGACLRRDTNATATGCLNASLTEISWPHKAEITNIRLTVAQAGTAGWDCTFTLNVDGAAPTGSTPLVSGPAPVLRTVLNQTQPIVVVNEGDLVEVKSTNTGTGAAICSPASVPQVYVELQGRWLYGTGSASQQN